MIGYINDRFTGRRLKGWLLKYKLTFIFANIAVSLLIWCWNFNETAILSRVALYTITALFRTIK